MYCIFCTNTETEVIETRVSDDGTTVRRRRQCPKCQRRFTSYERVEDVLTMVVKKDGRREPFDTSKVKAGLVISCKKRPIEIEVLDRIAEDIERKLNALNVKEIESSWIGEAIMSALKDLDKVAYVRFASVYRQFKDINDLMDEVKTLFDPKEKP